MEIHNLLIPVIIFLAGHLGTAIWFASKVKSKVDELSNSLEHISRKIEKLTAEVTQIKIFEARLEGQSDRLLRLETDTRDLGALRLGNHRLEQLETVMRTALSTSATALEVAKDHGEELETIRQSVSRIEGKIIAISR